MKYIAGLLLFLGILSAPLQSFAQTNPANQPSAANNEVPNAVNPSDSNATAGLESCFNYYTYGSVNVVLNSDTLVVAQGADLKLTGTIHNSNQYPIDDAAIYAKIYYKKDFNKSSFGPDVVDWFVLADHINMKAGETLPVNYTWHVPAGLLPGSYQVATFVASHDRFNLSGLSFSTDIVGNLFNFTVVGENLGALRFDNTQTVLNNHGYHTAIFAPRTNTPTNGVPVTAEVINTSSSDMKGSITWNLYSWDGLQDANVIDKTTTSVSVPAHGTTTVSYTIKDSSHTVYYLRAELTPENARLGQSIISVRYVLTKDAANTAPRIAFVGANGYPAVGDATKAFACINSTGTRAATGVRLELSTKPLDPISWLIHFGSLGSKSYSGVAPGAVSALAIPLAKDSNNFAVTATLYQNGKEIDSVTSDYSCKTFGGGCSFIQTYGLWILILIIVLLLVFITLLISQRKRTPSVTPPTYVA